MDFVAAMGFVIAMFVGALLWSPMIGCMAVAVHARSRPLRLASRIFCGSGASDGDADGIDRLLTGLIRQYDGFLCQPAPDIAVYRRVGGGPFEPSAFVSRFRYAILALGNGGLFRTTGLPHLDILGGIACTHLNRIGYLADPDGLLLSSPPPR